MIMTARGVEQQTDGHLAVRHFLNLVLATGKIGRPGCGYGAITGQGNGQGGREHGQKADQLPGYRSIENAQDREYVASVWGVAPETLPGKGVSAYEMMERVHEQEIRALLVMGSNRLYPIPMCDWWKKASASWIFWSWQICFCPRQRRWLMWCFRSRLISRTKVR